MESGLQLLGVTLFLACWLLAAASWLYAIWEIIGIYRLRETAFRRGWIVLSFSKRSPEHARRLGLGEIVKTKTGQFRFIDPQTCVFSLKFWWARAHSPFPIKGRLRWQGSMAHVEGRLPLGPTVFLSAVGAGLTTISFTRALSGKLAAGKVATIVFLVWTAIAITCLISVSFERRRSQAVVTEIQEHLAGDSES